MTVKSILWKIVTWPLPHCDVKGCNELASGDGPCGTVMCAEHANRAMEIDGDQFH